MGAIKDLVDLVTQLSNSVEDRKFAAELRQVQGMIGNIQSEHATLHEQRIDLMNENERLKKTISNLEEKISDLQKELQNIIKKPETKVNRLSDEAEKILILLSKQGDISSKQISHSISIDLIRTEYWLEELSKDEFVYFPLIAGSELSYTLDQKGREYLIKNNLI